ncbi:MAG: CsgG/HfaB family protein [Treponema sp.]|jgi:TolB-like protein|nr:CsgG/HfaB family protein [Treponema sp.]
MRKIGWVLLIGCVLGGGFIGCAHTPPAPVEKIGVGLFADGASEEAEIVITRPYDGYGGDLHIFIDGELQGTLAANEIAKFIVINGPHLLKVEWKNKRDAASDETKQVTAHSDRNVYQVKLNEVKGGYRLTLLSEGITVLSGSGVRKSSVVEEAVRKTYDQLAANISKGSKIAILSISAGNPNEAEFIIEELTTLLVGSKQYKVVDRKSLDAIREEQKFQMSGEVNDQSAVSIGEMVGAQIVITGSITGDGTTKRLRLKALDVQSSEIVAMSAERM